MNYFAVFLTLLVGSSSLALAQTAGGSSGGNSAASGSAATVTGYAGGTLSTGHTISGTAGSSGPNTGNAISQSATGDDAGASSVTQPPPSRDNAVDTPAAKNATNSLGNANTGILKK